MKQYPIPVSKRERILELLQIILENNEFTFNKKMYRQKTDVHMGGSPSAELADLRTFEILESVLNNFLHKNSIFCTRYRDDGFLIYIGTVDVIH